MSRVSPERREKFCQLVTDGMSLSKAYVAAGWSGRGKPATIQKSAMRMKKNAWVVKRLAELQAATEDTLIMTVKERKRRLSEIARARLTDFVEVDEKGTHIKVDLQSANSAALQEVTTESIGGGDKSFILVTKLKLHPPIPAIAELNKMDKVYEPDKGGDTYNTQFNIIVSSDKAKELTEQVAQRLISGRN